MKPFFNSVGSQPYSKKLTGTNGFRLGGRKSGLLYFDGSEPSGTNGNHREPSECLARFRGAFRCIPVQSNTRPEAIEGAPLDLRLTANPHHGGRRNE